MMATFILIIKRYYLPLKENPEKAKLGTITEIGNRLTNSCEGLSFKRTIRYEKEMNAENPQQAIAYEISYIHADIMHIQTLLFD